MNRISIQNRYISGTRPVSGKQRNKARLNMVLAVLLLATFWLIPGSLSALTIKLGSSFPEGTTWDTVLRQMAAEWAEITNGEVRIRIYAGGIAGDDADMIRKMRFGQLDAAVLTTFGMKSIVPNSFVMSLPGILRSEEELDIALERYAPRFDADFVREGFQVLSWAKSGWAFIFSKNLVRTPEDLQREKLSVSSSDIEIAEAFMHLGFNVVPSALNEIVVGLQSGMLSAYYTAPMGAAAYQWFPQTPHMMDLPLAPILGGFVVSDRAWRRIPARYHDELRAAIDRLATQFANESASFNSQALELIQGYGVSITHLTTLERENWYNLLRQGHQYVLGENRISPAVYNDFIAFLESIR